MTKAISLHLLNNHKPQLDQPVVTEQESMTSSQSLTRVIYMYISNFSTL